MVERVVVNRIIHGDEDGERIELKPGDIIDTDELGMDEDDVARLDEPRHIRARQDTASPVEATERRSGRAGRARDPRAVEDKPRRGRPPKDASDEL